MLFQTGRQTLCFFGQGDRRYVSLDRETDAMLLWTGRQTLCFLGQGDRHYAFSDKETDASLDSKTDYTIQKGALLHDTETASVVQQTQSLFSYSACNTADADCPAHVQK